MRVITGNARGKKLKSLEGLDVRPTSDKVKESIFSIIQFDIPGASVLDLFAGSGQLGIEALSRGAEHCVFVDKSRDTIEIIKGNLDNCGLMSKVRILNMDSIEYLKVAKKGLDIVLVDPPYKMGLVEKALENLDSLLNEGAFVVCEHEKRLELKETYGKLNLYKNYKYGRIELTVYQMPFESNEIEEA